MSQGRCLLLGDETALERIRGEGGRSAAAIRYLASDLESYVRLPSAGCPLAALDLPRVEQIYSSRQEAESAATTSLSELRLQFSNTLLDTTLALLCPLSATPGDGGETGIASYLETRAKAWRTLIERVRQDQWQYAHREGSAFVLILILLGAPRAGELTALQEIIQELGFDRCYLMNHVLRGQELWVAREVWPPLVSRLLLRFAAERPVELKRDGGLWVWRAFELVLGSSGRSTATLPNVESWRAVREAVLSGNGGSLPQLAEWLDPINVPAMKASDLERERARAKANRDWLAVQPAAELRDRLRDQKLAAAKTADNFKVKASHALYDDPPRVYEQTKLAWHRIHNHPAVMQTVESQTAVVTGPNLVRRMEEATTAWEKLREKDEALAATQRALEGCARELERAQAGFVGATPRIIIAAVVVLALGYAAFISMEALSRLLVFPFAERWMAPVVVAACGVMGAIFAASVSFFAERQAGRRAVARWQALLAGFGGEFRKRSESSHEAVVASHRLHQRILAASGGRSLRELSARINRLLLRHFCPGQDEAGEALAPEQGGADATAPKRIRALLEQETLVRIQQADSDPHPHVATAQEIDAFRNRFLDEWREFAAKEDAHATGAFPAVPLWTLLHDSCRRLRRRLEVAAATNETLEAVERERRVFEESSDYSWMSWSVESLGREGLVSRHLLASDDAAGAQRFHWIWLPVLEEVGLLGLLFDEAPVEFAGAGDAASRPRVRKK